MALLETTDVWKRFYGLDVLRGVSLHVHPGEVVGLIGPNGSGKTTLFNCITGQYSVDAGRVVFKGRDITGYSPHRVCGLGVTRTFQMVQVYPGLSVRDNLLVALQEHQERSVLARVLRVARVREAEARARDRAAALLEEFALVRLADQPAGVLSYGQRKLLEFASALMAEPELILLDEPAAAVNPTMIERMKEHVRRIHARGKAFLIIEHNMSVVMDICERVVVLDHGEKIAEGVPAEIQRDPQVLQAYFGR